jgi:all-trans-retinol 13,14-reductase
MMMIPSYVYAIPLLSWLSPWLWMPLVLLAGLLRHLSWWPGQHVRLSSHTSVRASPFSPDRLPRNGRLDTIVIGSGSGGCAAANLLAQSGQRVLLLEQHLTRTGGCTHSFREDRAQGGCCEWDTGLHYTSMAMADRTQRAGAIVNFMTKGQQQWSKLEDPYDQVLVPNEENDGGGGPVGKTPGVLPRNHSIYSFVTGADRTVDSILESMDQSTNAPLKEKVRLWMELCRTVTDGFTALGISRILPVWLHFLVRQRIARLYTLASFTVRDVQYAVFNLGYSQDDLLAAHVCPTAPPGPEADPILRRLKAVLTHPIGDYAVQPREATFAAHGVTMAHYMDGAAYTVGATQNLSIRSASMVREVGGGEVLVDATVREIVMEGGRAVGVRVSNTSALAGCTAADQDKVPVTEIRAKNIVCATSIYNLYNKLLPQDLPVVKDFHDPSKCSVCQSNGHVFLFCKIRGDATALGLPKHNLWYFNGYDLDEAFDKYFNNPIEERPPTVYIGFPCTKDSTWKKRFPGVSNCILISDGLWEWFEKWQGTPVHNRGADYEAFKEKLSKHLLDILYETVPQVRDKVELHMLGTPLSEVTYLASWQGGSYGTKCTPAMFAEMNHKWTTTPHTSIPGLYLAGSDAFLPAVCGACYGGCFGAAAVLGHWGTLRLTWALLGDFAGSLKEDNPKLSWLGAYRLAAQKFISDK